MPPKKTKPLVTGGDFTREREAWALEMRNRGYNREQTAALAGCAPSVIGDILQKANVTDGGKNRYRIATLAKGLPELPPPIKQTDDPMQRLAAACEEKEPAKVVGGAERKERQRAYASRRSVPRKKNERGRFVGKGPTVDEIMDDTDIASDDDGYEIIGEEEYKKLVQPLIDESNIRIAKIDRQ